MTRLHHIRRLRASEALRTDMDARLAERRAARSARSEVSLKGARTKRHDLGRDPVMCEQVAL